jgi:hypothetical protein
MDQEEQGIIHARVSSRLYRFHRRCRRRQLLERLHLPNTEGGIRHSSAIALPEVPSADTVLSQYSFSQLSAVTRPLLFVRGADFFPLFRR